MKASQTFAYQKFAAHSRQHTPSSQWSASGTHKAQEIKAVNKGPSDKGSPDSYESLVSRTPSRWLIQDACGWAGGKKTNHNEEHEGLDLALPIPNDPPPSFTPLFTASRAFPAYLLTTAEELRSQNLGGLSSFPTFNCAALLCLLELGFYRHSACNDK